MNTRFRTKTTDWTKVADGSRKAHKNVPQTTEHKANISKRRKEFNANNNGKILEAIRCGSENEIRYFKSGADAARFLNCSRQLVSQAIRCEKGYSAKGWVFKWVSLENVIKF